MYLIKTKIVVFRKRGLVFANECWSFNGNALEVVNDFNYLYLGVVFNYTGSLNLNQQTLSGKALKAMNILLQNVRGYDLSPRTLCQLFDAFVASILNYCSEVWGYMATGTYGIIQNQYGHQSFVIYSSSGYWISILKSGELN